MDKFMNMVKEFDALVLFYFIIGFSVSGIVTGIHELFLLIQRKWQKHKAAVAKEKDEDILG